MSDEYSKDPNKYIFTTKDADGKSVALKSNTWTQHILKKGQHKELSPDTIREGIEKAHIVTPDKDYDDRRIYRRMLARHPVPGAEHITTVKVVVEETSSDFDEVVTSHLISNLRGERNPEGRSLYDSASQDGTR